MKSKFLLAGVLLVSVAAVPAAGEFYVRLFSRHGHFTPETLKKQYLEYVPALFARYLFPEHAKQARGMNGIVTSINSKGYRGPEFSREKPAGKTRILFYGGSAVFDLAAPDGKDWPRHVETLLHEKGFPEVEVINGGTPGHAAFDCLGRFYTEGHLFKPDYVVLYSSWNDVKFFGETKPLLRTLRPFDPQADPLLNYQNSLDRFLAGHSQLYVRLRYRYFLEVTLRTFVDLVRNAGGKPVLMTEARLVTRQNTEEEKKKIQYEYQKLVPEALREAYEKADETIKRIAAERNVPLIDASAEMTGNSAYFLDHVHLTEEGSKILAELTTRNIGAELKRVQQV